MSEKDELELEEGMETGPDILTLSDDEGNEHQFEVVDTAEVDGSTYMALVPVFDEAADLLEDSGELVVLKVVEEDGEEFLEVIEDEEEFNKMGNFFVERLSDTFDFEE